MRSRKHPPGRAATVVALVVALSTLAASGPAGAATRSPQRARTVRVRAARAANLSIAAVYYDPYAGPDPDTNAGRNKEYVVIRNGGSSAARLTGWTIRDLARPGVAAHVFKFPAFRLRPGHTVRIHTGRGSNTRTDLYWGLTVYVWGDDSDKATLKNKSGGTVDTCSWTTADTSPKFC